ncbi:YgiQ family radical SAM protein [Papillibacter cinnamivorans]|uniref:Uncharacterized radical SAM protein YgiQ n=1 Tax=Papillibacter cinnamivorans DSM 12816 TaxID=1122930 RepID=A0A1W2BWQ8_9FIRM|nr:YgiQ family radical SAM protein [Papillibacter cinnamivorans]SMC77437.1 uncharacterized radical SAM protein YgiQ [Papillibacter cinnamivorans DSM 12816]
MGDSKENAGGFLPVNLEDLRARNWDFYDFLVISGDAYVDHPSFGAAVIARVLEAEGYRVAFLAQPDWHSAEPFRALGRPRLAALITGGNIDSMVAHYTAAKRRRSDDAYSPGNRAGLRPDRAAIVYSNRIREAWPDLPVILGGLEASLRRFAHYDYWEDKVRRSILADSGADLLIYGMGERAVRETARSLSQGLPVSEITGVRGTAYFTKDPAASPFPMVECYSFEAVSKNKREYAEATRIQYEEHDNVRGRGILQKHGQRWLAVNPPAAPLDAAELDRAAELPYMRRAHPMYDELGGVPAIEEVRFSVIHNRGCFGACNFCSLAFHQGRMVTARSQDSVIREVEGFIKNPLFKGYVHDVGGPTANFRHPSCKKQAALGMCKDKNCLFPEPCPNLDADQSDYLKLLRRLRAIPGVKKVFIRSGIRFDYLLADKNGEFFSELVKYHVSGQLKVAPEHCVSRVLYYMGKPQIQTYEKFKEKYERLNRKYGKEQYLVPYLMSSHPGCRLQDAVELAEYLNRTGRQPEQVQDFYPTPGTLSTCMYYTGIDPRTMKEVYVPRDKREKALQRALLQWKRPDKRRLVLEALREAGREDLIGYGKNCLVRPEGVPSSKRKQTGGGKRGPDKTAGTDNKRGGKTPARGSKRPPAGGKRPAGGKKKAAG